MKDWRCRCCGRKLAEVDVRSGSISVKCEKCGAYNTYEVEEVDRQDELTPIGCLTA